MLQEIPNEHRLIFVLDVVIAVRAGELLGLRWLDFRPERQTLSITAAYGEGGSVRRRRKPAYDLFIFRRRLSSYSRRITRQPVSIAMRIPSSRDRMAAPTTKIIFAI